MPFSIEEQSTRTSMIMQQTADHFLSLRVMKLSPYELTIATIASHNIADACSFWSDRENTHNSYHNQWLVINRATNLWIVTKNLVRHLVPFTILIPLSTLVVACSKGDVSNTPNQQVQVVDASKESDVNDDSSQIIVTENNFPQAYTNLAMPQ